jgi:hypothetical protein
MNQLIFAVSVPAPAMRFAQSPFDGGSPAKRQAGGAAKNEIPTSISSSRSIRHER